MAVRVVDPNVAVPKKYPVTIDEPSDRVLMPVLMAEPVTGGAAACVAHDTLTAASDTALTIPKVSASAILQSSLIAGPRLHIIRGLELGVAVRVCDANSSITAPETAVAES